MRVPLEKQIAVMRNVVESNRGYPVIEELMGVLVTLEWLEGHADAVKLVAKMDAPYRCVRCHLVVSPNEAGGCSVCCH